MNYKAYVRKHIGGDVELATDRVAVADFNRDGKRDVAAPVRLAGPPAAGVVVQPSGDDPAPPTALAILHGREEKAGRGTPLGRYLITGVPAGDLRVRFAGPDPANVVPLPAQRSDAIFGDLGVVNPGIVYWDGSGYRIAALPGGSRGEG